MLRIFLHAFPLVQVQANRLLNNRPQETRSVGYISIYKETRSAGYISIYKETRSAGYIRIYTRILGVLGKLVYTRRLGVLGILVYTRRLGVLGIFVYTRRLGNIYQKWNAVLPKCKLKMCYVKKEMKIKFASYLRSPESDK